MNVNLTPHLEAMIREKVASGRYSTSSEVVREALCLMEEQDRLNQLRAALAVAQASKARGDVRPWTPERLNEIWQSAVAGSEAGEKPNPVNGP